MKKFFGTLAAIVAFFTSVLALLNLVDKIRNKSEKVIYIKCENDKEE